MIISLVIEKLISMIVPAAGAILTIIQGLVAAWGTISKIIAAFGKFLTFLKAVKAGGVAAACLFAGAVASGVVALLDFITNFLLQRLGSALKGVATKLKGIAQKIMKGLSKAGKGARKAAGGAVNRARQSLRTASQALRGPSLAAHGGPGAMRRPKIAGRPTTRAHPVTRPTHHEPEPHLAHQPTAPKPKPRPARPALSTAGRVLTRVKNAVRSGLRKVRNATRALGRKLRNSKLGRALTNTAHKIRDKYTRTRDKLRDQSKKRQQQRNERGKNKNSPKSKQQRLDLIIARIKPKVEFLLKRGIRSVILRFALDGLSRWYRLTAMRIIGDFSFTIRAFLNPDAPVVLGTTVNIAGVDAEVDNLLRALRLIGTEVHEAGAGSVLIKEGYLPKASGGRRQALIGKPGARAAEFQAALRNRKRQPGLKTDVVRIERDNEDPIEVLRKAGSGGKTPRGKRKPPKPWNRPITRPVPGTPGAVYSPSYDELVNDVTATGREQSIARQALNLVQGRPPTPSGQDDKLVAELGIWFVNQEGHRGAASMATHAMVLDVAARGHLPFADAMGLAPMRQGDAQENAVKLRDYLAGEGNKRVGAERLAEAELKILKVWVESIKNTLKVDSNATAKEKERQLILEIRRKIHELHAVKPDEVGAKADFWTRLERRDVPR